MEPAGGSGGHAYSGSLAVRKAQEGVRAAAARLGNIELYTEGLDKEQVKDVFVRRVLSLAKAVIESASRHRNREIAVVPEGPYVIPRCESRARPRQAHARAGEGG